MTSENIILYSTHCPMCRLVERKLNEKNIKYSENNNIDDMTKLGFTSVPVLDVDGKLYSNTKEILNIIDILN